MRKALIVLTILVSVPAAARAQEANSSVVGFGGLTFGSMSTFAGTSASPSFGGTVAAGVAPVVQLVGGVGRLSDIKPPLFDLLDFTPVSLRVSALYGEGGVRFIAPPRSGVRPYGEATAGVARLNTSLTGLGERMDPLLNVGLGLVERNEPLFGVGGGFLFERGALAVDIGYRYKKFMTSGVSSVINAGDDYRVSEARIGVGVRF